MIRFDNVSIKYSQEGSEVLKEASFHIPPGKMAFLLGKSGSGKTTILRLLLRELTPDEGLIRVNGQDISRIRHRKMPAYRRKMGVIFQDYRLIKDQTVYENVAIAKRIVGAGKKDTLSRVTMALRMVGLEKDFYRPVSELSGGEQQRVCIARAIAGNPDCILADEPTGNLDPEQGRQIMLLLERINQTGITVLVATHDTQAIRDMDHPRFYLEHGSIRIGE